MWLSSLTDHSHLQFTPKPALNNVTNIWAISQSAGGEAKEKAQEEGAGSLHKNLSAAGVNKSGFPWVHRHLPHFLMNEPEL